LGEDGQLFLGGRGEHILGELHPWGRRPNPDPQPGHLLVPQGGEDGAHTVVGARPTTGAQPELPHRQIHIIVDDQKIVRGKGIIPEEFGYRLSGSVHERERAEE